MAFLSRLIPGECPVCLLDLGMDAIAHPNGGGLHPIHRRCLQAWVNAAEARHQTPTCPTCGIKVTSIETKGAALFRMSKEGDLASIQVLKKDGSSLVFCDLAICTASEKGHHQIVDALLERGTMLSEMRGVALKSASRNGHAEVVESLLYKGIGLHGSVSDDDLEDSLNAAREQGHKNIVAELEKVQEIRTLFKEEGDTRVENIFAT